MDGPLNKNLYALLENHNRGPVKWSTDEHGDRVWSGGAYPVICLEGASRSGKTWSWLEYLIIAGEQMPGLVSTAFRADAATHEKAAWRDFRRIMAEKYPAVLTAGRLTQKPMQFTHSNGSLIEFCGLNDPAKLHGPERDIAIINEAMEANYDAYVQISARTRLLTILDWNPSNSLHWVFDKVLGTESTLYIHSTYKDNPHLTETQIAAIEAKDPSRPVNVRNKTADKWWWEVYGLGKRGRREGTVFDFYEVTDFFPEPNQCQKWGWGMDFGYSSDPTAVVECAIFQGRLYLREWLYRTGLTTIRSHAQPNIPSIQGEFDLLGFDRRWKILADGARPDQIAELVAEGYNVYGAGKGKGSILAGIDLMKRFPIYIHRGSANLQNEFQQYVWRKHARGYTMAEPEDSNNHAIDAVRYWCLDELAGWQPVQRDFDAPTVVQGTIRKRY